MRSGVQTSGGSSGSPVFDTQSHQLVGVHFAGSGATGLAVAFSPTVEEFLNQVLVAISMSTRLQEYLTLARTMTNPSPALQQSMQQAISKVEAMLVAKLPYKVQIVVPGYNI